ncbi:MAG: heparinase II/III family protein [Rhodospirillales bacterium]|nr:heparinase II/III family protein [Rhodospirillales bacterium]
MFDIVPDRVRQFIFSSAVYDWWLAGKPPSSVRVPLGDAGLGAEAAWYADQLSPPQGLMAPKPRDDFRWLGAPHARNDQAWPAIADWLAANKRWHIDHWRADILGERLIRWLAAYDVVSIGIDPLERQTWAAAIAQNARHLNRLQLKGIAPWRRFLVHQARINAAIALPELEHTLARRISEFGQDVDKQILRDGGHIERSPAKDLAVLAILAELQDALIGHHVQPPAELVAAIDRMVPLIKALCHGDGGFALFNGTVASTAPLIEAVIMASGGKGRALTSAPYSGFHRLRAGQTTLIVDCGETLSQGPSFRGPASFELSNGKIRLIGNCGMRLADDATRPQWLSALSSTAAHSTLVINDKDAGAVSKVTVNRRDHEGARLIEMSHNGYQGAFGIMHRRAIYIDGSGSDVRGEDALSGGRSQPFSVRFQLYPDIRASMVSGGGEVIIKPPRGRGWRFSCAYPVMLEDSVSFFDGRQHRAQQIVILGNHEPAETIVKWRIAIDG